MDIEEQIKSIIYDFPDYKQIFDEFKIGFIHRARLLALIYLFSSPPELPLAARKLMIASLDFENLTVPESAISKGFGDLVIMKTAGYASKTLYFALDVVRGELD